MESLQLSKVESRLGRESIMADRLLEPISGYVGDRLIVDHVTIPIAARKTTVIFGPSGSGKTTLLRILAGLWTGKVVGGPIDPIGVGYVAQRDFLFPWMTLAKN